MPITTYSSLTAYDLQNASLIVADYSKRFHKVLPAKYPTATFGLVNTGSEMSDTVVRWGEKESLQRSTSVSDTSLTNTTDPVTANVTSSEGMRVGMHLLNIRTMEVYRITAVPGATSVTVARGQQGTTPANGAIYDVLLLLTHPMDEFFAYSNLPSALMHFPVEVYNEMETFAEPIKISNRELALIKRGHLKFGEKLQDKQDDAMELVKAALNRSLIFGIRSSVAGSDGRKTTTGGLIWHPSNTDAAAIGDITNKTTFENAIKATCLIAGNEDMMMTCSPIVLQAVQRLYQGAGIGNYSGEVVKEVGVQVTKIYTPWGTTLHCYLDTQMVDYYSTAARGHFILWNPKNVKWRPNRAIGRYEVPPTSDGWTQVILGEGAWELGPGKAILYGSGVTPVS